MYVLLSMILYERFQPKSALQESKAYFAHTKPEIFESYHFRHVAPVEKNKTKTRLMDLDWHVFGRGSAIQGHLIRGTFQ